ncbi:ATP-dependent zinc metalloprotease FtsH [Aquisalimonas sp. APHAB1-3]|uniref:ATP-dependent zinc metalloprotease FtsH n=2 Tax=unclassified Aquisalimonas TaxID=2644645 RepID=UPI003AAE45E6
MPKLPKPRIPEQYGWLLFALALLIVLLMLSTGVPTEQRHDIPYSTFKTLTRDGVVLEVTMRGHQVEGQLSEQRSIGPDGERGELFATRIPASGDDGLLPLLEQQRVSVQVKPDTDGAGLTRLLFFVPWLFLILLFFLLFRRTAGGAGGSGPGGLGDFLNKGIHLQANVPKVRFDDVAGHTNAKREVTELVEFMRDPQRYRKLGADVPHGVLLMGPPGTGKTLLARALAGEAGVPFFSISASEFIEVYVGVGASRVRRLFEAAKKAAPAIIFIDELDSVGRTRGAGVGGGHDEREQTLNQILAEMDGFESSDAVIVLAATNRPDVLDPALLRPGRFDRHVTLDLPDRQEREAILAVHTSRVPLADDADLARISAGTPGFSGADLRNLVNEAAMAAAREDAEQVAMKHFEECRDRLLLGTARTLAIHPEERHRLAVHECGHTVVAYHAPDADPLYKVSIIPRGRSLGGTQQLSEHERQTLTEDYLHGRLAVLLGGRAAERVVLGNVSSGADDDIRQATSLARAMVGRWGMSPDLGPVDLRDSDDQPFLGREMALHRHHSEHAARQVDEAVHALLKEAEGRAEAIITKHRAAFDRLVQDLEQQETLDREAIEQCLTDEPAATGASSIMTR